MTATDLPSAAEPAALTATMREAGVLDRGAVSDVSVISDRPMLISRIIRLALTYQGEAPDAPQTLILKVPLPAFAKTLWQGGRHEVNFYRKPARVMPPRLVPGCFGGGWDKGALTWHLLLEDLTETHQTATQWPVPPALPEAKAIVRALARLHAAWWDDPRLGVSIGSFATPEETTKHSEVFAGHYRRFAVTYNPADILPSVAIVGRNGALVDYLHGYDPAHADRLLARFGHYEFVTPIELDIGVACCPTHGTDIESLKRATDARVERDGFGVP
jgi:hypothetical protein